MSTPDKTPKTAAPSGKPGQTAPADRPAVKFVDVVRYCRDALAKWGWTVLLAVSVFLIGYYTLFPSRGYFHSDTTDSLMWAVASNESGSLFNEDFNYACLLPFSTSLIMTALIPLFGVTMTTHVLSMLIFFLLFTAALVWLLRKLDWSWNWVAFGVFVELMICSGSEKLREIFWGHSIYYSLGVFFIFVGLALLFRHMDLLEKRTAIEKTDTAARKKSLQALIVSAVLLFVWLALTCMDQIIAITIFALPIMAAVFCERWLDHDTKLLSKKNLPALLIFLVMGAGMVAGYLITAVAAKDIVAGYEGAYSNYSDMGEWADHLLSFPQQWFSLLGADMRLNEPLMSVKSVGDLLIVITGVVLLVVPVMALCFYKKLPDRKSRVLVLTHWFMVMLIMMGYIMGKLSNANWRLSPIVATSALVTILFLRWAVGEISLQRIMTLMMIPLTAVCLVTGYTVADMPINNTEDNDLYMLAEELEERGLSYGYASFWRANGLTVAADSQVQCRSVTIDEAGCRPYYYQSCRSWFDKQPGVDKYFLILDAGEVAALQDQASPLVDLHRQEFSIGSYTVWVFNDNIF